MKRGAVVAMVTVLACFASTASAKDDPTYTNIRIASTSDTVDAGLFTVTQDGFGDTAYRAKYPNDTYTYTGVGTGAAITRAKNAQADVLVTHAPSLEAQFVKDGYSLGLGKQIFYSDYVIIGPQTDPAGVLANHPHDAIGAFEDIAAAGAAGTASFVTRGDNSGTDVQEENMWAMTSGITLAPSLTPASAGDATRKTPANSAAWYRKSGKTQGPNVTETDLCPTTNPGGQTYPQGSCYTMVDRGTFNRLLNDPLNPLANLKIVSEKNAPSARGGENLLINPFSVYVVNPDKFPDGSKPDPDKGKRFADFLVSPAFQQALDGFPSAADPAFHSDAVAGVTLDDAVPASVVRGSSVTLKGTAANKLPGGGPADQTPITLQSSTDNGTTWTDVSNQTTGSDGRFTFTFAPTATATYRASLAGAAAAPFVLAGEPFPYHVFTAGTQGLGAITVAEPVPTPTVTPT